MTTLIVGIVIFFGIHLLPMTPLKPPARKALGNASYRLVFALISIVGIGIMIWGFAITRYGPTAALIAYNPPSWGRHVTMLLVLLAFISLMVSFHKGRLKLWLKHPMSIGIALWATGHLFANGNWNDVFFFGTFLALSLLDIIYNLARGRGPDPNMKVKPIHDVIAVVGGVVLYAIMLFLHPYLFGVSVI